MKIKKSALRMLIKNTLLEYKDASSKFSPMDFGDSAKSADKSKEDTSKSGKKRFYARDEEEAISMADKNPGSVILIADSLKKEDDINYKGKVVTDPNDKKYQYRLDDTDENNLVVDIIRTPKDSNVTISNPETVDKNSKEKVYNNILELFQ